MKTNYYNLSWIISVGLFTTCWIATSLTTAVQQQHPDAVRHELSRFNHAGRFLTTVTPGSVLYRTFRTFNSASGRSNNILPSSSSSSFSSSSTSSSGLDETDLSAVSYRLGRPARFVSPQLKVVRLVVLAPSDPEHQFSLLKILPAITLAARTIERNSNNSGGPLPGWRIQIVNRDSKCSSIYGPLEAIDLYNSKAIGVSVHLVVDFFLFFSIF